MRVACRLHACFQSMNFTIDRVIFIGKATEVSIARLERMKQRSVLGKFLGEFVRRMSHVLFNLFDGTCRMTIVAFGRRFDGDQASSSKTEGKRKGESVINRVRRILAANMVHQIAGLEADRAGRAPTRADKQPVLVIAACCPPQSVSFAAMNNSFQPSAANFESEIGFSARMS